MHILFTAAFLLSTCMVSAQTTDDRREPSLALAEELFCGFNYADATRIYEELLAADSTNFGVLTRISESWNFRGLDLQSQEKKDSAEEAFERAVGYAEQTRRHHGDSAKTYVNLAAAYGDLALFRGGKAKVHIGRNVKRFCEHALSIDSTNVAALTILGVFNRELSKLSWIQRLVAKTIYGGLPGGSIQKSAEFLEKAIEIDSMALFPNYSLAVTYRSMKEEEAALAQLEKVVSLQPGNSEEARYRDNAAAWLAEVRTK